MTGVQVLVVGAGPTGLVLAAQLARAGVRLRVVDAAPVPAQESRAFGVSARTLAVLDDLGIADEAVRRGRPLRAITVHAAGQAVARIPIRASGDRFSLLGLPQDRIEQLLRRAAEDLGVTVEQSVRLTALTTGPEGATATLIGPGGERETCRADWVVGCDGAHSAVRGALGLPWRGADVPGRFVLADVHAPWGLTPEGPHVVLSPAGVLALFPLPGEDRWRVIAAVGPGSDDDTEPDLGLVRRLVEERTALREPVTDLTWSSRFSPRERSVGRYLVGRVLVAGDAAHTHSPVGAQGLNTGVQDAHNLAWKLALVTAGHADAALLDTYGAERLPVARRVLLVTRLATRLVTRGGPAAAGRARAVAAVGGSPLAGRVAGAALDQGWVRYRRGPLVGQRWDGRSRWVGQRGGPRPGDLAPDGPLLDGGHTTRVLHLLRGQHHVLLLFEGSAAGDLTLLARRVEAAYGDVLRVHRVGLGGVGQEGGVPDDALGLTDADGSCHRRYDAERPCLYLLRPDGHVGFRARPPALGPLAEYLDTRVLHRPPGRR